MRQNSELGDVQVFDARTIDRIQRAFDENSQAKSKIVFAQSAPRVGQFHRVS